MKSLNILLLFAAMLLVSCQPRINTILFEQYQVFDYPDEIKVYEADDAIKFEYTLVGRTQAVGSAFNKDCAYDELLAQLKEEVRNAGGNAIQIVKTALPKGMNKCHSIYANILDVDFDNPTTDSKFTDAMAADRGGDADGEFIATEDRQYSKLDIGAVGGWGYQIGRDPDETKIEERDYLKSLKTGFFWGAEAAYYPWNKAGFGLEFNQLSRSNTLTDGARLTSLTEDITTNYYGAYFTTRDLSQNNKSFSGFRVGLGAMDYTNITGGTYHSADDLNETYTGISPTLNFGFDYNQKLNSRLALSFGAALYLATKGVNNVWYDVIYQGATTRTENLSRFQFTVKLKYLAY